MDADEAKRARAEPTAAGAAPSPGRDRRPPSEAIVGGRTRSRSRLPEPRSCDASFNRQRVCGLMEEKGWWEAEDSVEADSSEKRKAPADDSPSHGRFWWLQPIGFFLLMLWWAFGSPS